MCDTVPDGERGNPVREYVFRCSTCQQEIAVNDEMRTAILENGCPVCTAAVDEADFEE